MIQDYFIPQILPQAILLHMGEIQLITQMAAQKGQVFSPLTVHTELPYLNRTRTSRCLHLTALAENRIASRSPHTMGIPQEDLSVQRAPS